MRSVCEGIDILAQVPNFKVPRLESQPHGRLLFSAFRYLDFLWSKPAQETLWYSRHFPSCCVEALPPGAGRGTHKETEESCKTREDFPQGHVSSKPLLGTATVDSLVEVSKLDRKLWECSFCESSPMLGWAVPWCGCPWACYAPVYKPLSMFLKANLINPLTHQGRPGWNSFCGLLLEPYLGIKDVYLLALGSHVIPSAGVLIQ